MLESSSIRIASVPGQLQSRETDRVGRPVRVEKAPPRPPAPREPTHDVSIRLTVRWRYQKRCVAPSLLLTAAREGARCPIVGAASNLCAALGATTPILLAPDSYSLTCALSATARVGLLLYPTHKQFLWQLARVGSQPPSTTLYTARTRLEEPSDRLGGQAF